MKSFDEFLCVFKKYFSSLDTEDKIAVSNAYEDSISGEGQIYNNDEDFFELFFSGIPPYEVAMAVQGSNWNWMDEYVWFNGYGNIESGNDYNLDFPTIDIAKNLYDNRELIDDIEDYGDVLPLRNFF